MPPCEVGPLKPDIFAGTHRSILNAVGMRVLSRQWQREFCRCSIDVVGGKQCDGGVDHLKRFRHHTGPSPKAGEPMAQPAVDPLDRHRFILADIMPPNRQELVVRRIIVCTVQLDAPGFCYAAPALLRSLSSAAPATGSTWRHHDRHIPSRRGVGQSDQKPTRSTACSFFEGNARVRPVPSRPRSRPTLVEGAVRAVRHELGSNSGSTGLKHRVAWRWHSSTGPACITAQRFLSSTAARRAAA